MSDLSYASHLAQQIGMAFIIPATILQLFGPSILGRFATLFGLVFLGWALLFYLAQYLPWTYLGL